MRWCEVDWSYFFFQAEDGIRDLVRSRGLGDVYKRQGLTRVQENAPKGTVVPDWVPPQPKTFAKMELPALSLIHI